MSTTTLTFRIFNAAQQLVREERLSQSVIKLGKVASAHVRLEDESVSRMHAIIEVIGDQVSLIDLGSTRGTFVNGQKINKALLRSGDVLQLGDSRIEIAIALAVDAVAPTVVAPPPVPRTAPIAPVAPIGTPKAPPVMIETATPVDTATEIASSGKAIEVAAMLGDTVVGVKHVANPKSGKLSGTTLGMFATGAAALLASTISFGLAVKTASANDDAAKYAKNVLHKPQRAIRNATNGVGLDFTGFGGAALGIACAVGGLARAKREKQSPYYRIGTAAGVDLAVETTTEAAFPLVAPKGDDFVLNFTSSLGGEMTTADGRTTPLADLAHGAPASTTVANAVELPIPANAKIRVTSGQATMLVSAVAKPAVQPSGFFAPDKRALVYGAASLAAHLGMIAVLAMVPVDDTSASLDIADIETAHTGGKTPAQDDPTTPKDPDEKGDNDKGQGQKEALAMALKEGAAGDKTSQASDGHITIAKHDNSEEHLAREAAVEAARTAGILGDTRLSDSLRSVTGELDLSNGGDATNSWGPIYGADGSMRGFGTGRSDMGTGGGCAQEPCGIQGTGHYGTIPGGRGGDDYIAHVGGPNGHGHEKLLPSVHMDRPTTTDGLDKKIIARYIHRTLPNIQYCYEKELLSRPDINGTINVSFFIGGDGTVQSSSATNAFDATVGSCVAGVVKDIHFPATEGGAGVTVNYPFTFHKSGS